MMMMIVIMMYLDLQEVSRFGFGLNVLFGRFGIS